MTIVHPHRREGFTLVELLVVIAIVGLLAGLGLPALRGAKAAGERARCTSNLQQLFKANELYALDKETYVAAAPDIWGRNLQRWHGVRQRISASFDGTAGPLVSYLGSGGSVRACPSMRGFRSGFEAGCGGYGYNQMGVGSQAYDKGLEAGAAAGIKPTQLTEPGGTVMFADTAFREATSGGGLIEYSFAEAYFTLSDLPPVSEAWPAKPSIHFRHADAAQVVWCDGHVTHERMQTTYNKLYTEVGLGWFGQRDNALFTPYRQK